MEWNSVGSGQCTGVFGVVVVVVHGNGGGLRYAGGNNISLANIGASSNIYSLAEGCAQLTRITCYIVEPCTFGQVCCVQQVVKDIAKNRDIL